ncbi:MAG: hypothetical protein WA477_23450 [Candidatus Sulfotelmatobacter sp.]
MKFRWVGGNLRYELVFGLILFMGSGWALAQNPAAQNDVVSIIQKSVEANDRDWKADPAFDYFERDRSPDGTKTYDVTNILGSPYERLIEINGKPLTARQRDEEQKKFDAMVSQRRAETPEQRKQRIAKYEADRSRDHEMLAQLTKAFDFKLQGEQKIAHRKVYVLKATPRRGYQPPNRDTEVLPGMEGRLWIDAVTCQWVKVEAHVIRPVSIEGFLAQVEPGTRFELEKAPVQDDIWLPIHYAMRASAKVFFLFPHHSQDDETYFNYHPSPATPSNQSSGSTQSTPTEASAYAHSRPANR